MDHLDADLLLGHSDFLRALARGVLRDEHAAEDVVQDAMVAAIERPPRHGNLRAWLARVTRNLAISSRRSRQRRAWRERIAARGEGVDAVDDGVARLELQRRVVQAVLSLDEPYRSAIVLRYHQDLPVKGVARELGVPLETARTRLRRGHALLRGRLDADYGGDRGAWSLGLFAMAWPARTGAAAGGIALMGIKAKVLIGFAVLAVLALLGREVLDEEEPPPRRQTEAGRPPEEAGASPEAEETQAPPVDFATVDRDRELHGTVVDPEGKPIAGARVVVVRRPGQGHDMSALMLEEIESPPLCASADGRFVIRLRRGEQVDLEISAPGYAPRRLRWRLAGGRERVVLRKGRPLEVRVVDPDGRPVEGATVEYFLSPRANAQLASGVVALPARRTDAGGRCAWESVHAADAFTLFVRHPGFWIGNARVPLWWAGEIEVALQRGATLRGRVTDRATGEPIAGAIVGPAPLAWPKSVRTDEQGRYEIAGVRGFKEGGAVPLFAWAEGYAVSRADTTGKANIDFALGRGLDLAGRFLDGRGEPVADVLVSAIGGGALDLDSRSTRSDAEGRFVVRGLRPEIGHALIATKPGHARLLLDAGVYRGEGEGEGESPRIDLGDIVFGSGFALEGRLLDDRGDPIPQAVVLCVGGDNKWGHGGEVRCLTDDRGRFRFRVTGPARWTLSAELADRRTFSREVEVDRDRFDVELKSASVHRFTVRVQDEGGAPVAGVTVAAWRTEGKTDEGGLARFEIPVGETRGWVAVLPDGTGFLRRVLRDRRYDAGELVVALEKGVLLRGRVVDEAGSGLDSVGVYAKWIDAESERTSTDADGAFHLTVPGDSPVEVHVSGKRAGEPKQVQSRVLRVAAGQNDIEIRTRVVVRDRRLKVRVVDPDGGAVSGVPVLCWEIAKDRPLAVTDVHGRAVLEGLPDKEIQIQAGRGRRQGRGWAEPLPRRILPDGQEVVLAYRAALVTSGRVLFPEGISGRVGVIALREEMVATTVTALDGTFRLVIPVDDATPVRIEVMPPDQVDPNYQGPELAPGRLENVEPGAAGIEIRLERAE